MQSPTSIRCDDAARRYYTDPGVFRDELERFFCRTGSAPAHQPSPKAATIFCVRSRGEHHYTRDGSNSLRAFFNVCRHRGTRICALDKGHFTGRIQCPYHGWTYGLDGRLMGAPTPTKASATRTIPSIPFMSTSGTDTSSSISAPIRPARRSIGRSAAEVPALADGRAPHLSKRQI